MLRDFQRVNSESPVKHGYEDERIRNAVEGKIGEGKRKYSTDRVMTKLRETSDMRL